MKSSSLKEMKRYIQGHTVDYWYGQYEYTGLLIP